MTLIEIGSTTELTNFISKSNVCVVTFSAHWCGPCKASKPKLKEIAESSIVPVGIVHEDSIGDYLHTFSITAFPTYVLFVNKVELERVEGANLDGVNKMIAAHADKHGSAIPQAGGNTLGGSHSAEEAKALRLAKLESKKKEDMVNDEAIPMETEESKSAAAPPVPSSIGDESKMEEDSATGGGENKTNPVDNLDKAAIKTLTEEMGFSLLRAQKGLLFSTGGTVASAVEYLMVHQDDADIDEAIPEGTGSVDTARSYKCNECGKILSNMANLELHANKTGHSDFEESTCIVKPLTPEEKAAKILEIKQLLAAKRAEREETEKVDQTQREKQRRFMGKEMLKTKEEMDKDQRKRDASARKREKLEQKREKARIIAELEKDKRERMANKGKLKGRLGVDGYAPSAIQYDNKDINDGDGEEPAAQRPKTGNTANAANIDEYITKVSSYRAGGDGGKSLKVLKLLVGNAAENPNEDKFKKINMETNAYKNKVKPFVGAKNILLAVGFAIPREGNDRSHLILKEDADFELLKSTKIKLEQALVKYG